MLIFEQLQALLFCLRRGRGLLSRELIGVTLLHRTAILDRPVGTLAARFLVCLTLHFHLLLGGLRVLCRLVGGGLASAISALTLLTSVMLGLTLGSDLLDRLRAGRLARLRNHPAATILAIDIRVDSAIERDQCNGTGCFEFDNAARIEGFKPGPLPPLS